MRHIPGKFIWFEHVSEDPGRARDFYAALFGWNTEAAPLGDRRYDMIHNAVRGIGGLAPAPAGAPGHWASHLSVADVDAAYRMALACGAKSALAPQDFPPVGRGATVIDPAGAVVSLWRSSEGDPPDVEDVPVGDWAWNELLSTDIRQALAFYGKAFSLAHEKMALEGFDYYVLKSADGKSRAGATQAPQGLSSRWVPYVRVANADETAAKAEKLGGRLMMPVETVPGVGEVATATDPLGAMFAFIRPAPM